MGKEIERKFLVKGNRWRSLGKSLLYRQGYINTAGKETVRVRIVGSNAYLTIKGATEGKSRLEFEYSIPIQDAQEMLDNLCSFPLIEKKRYKIPIENLVWEVDEFMGENEGLIIAEVELQAENQQIILPDWIEREVSDPRYYNANLAKYPYNQWKNQ